MSTTTFVSTLRRLDPPAVSKRLRNPALAVIGAVLFLVAWQLLAIGPFRDSTLPLASDAIVALIGAVGTGAFWVSTLQTLGISVLGFAFGVVIAVPLGLVMGLSKTIYSVAIAIIEVTKPIPPIVLLPLAVLVYGTNAEMAQVLIVFTVVPALTVVTIAGVYDVDPIAIDSARAYQIGPLSRLGRIVLPSTLPYVATGLRIAVMGALIVTIMAGLFGGAPGLGRDLATYRFAGRDNDVFAYVIAIGLLGLAINIALAAVETRILFWHETVRDVAERADRPTGPTPVVSTAVDLMRAISEQGWAVKASDTVNARVYQAKKLLTERSRGPSWIGQTGPPRPVRTATYGTIMVAVPLVLLAWWWVWSENGDNPFFPPLQEIMVRFQEIWLFDKFSSDVVPSLVNLVVGFAIAVVAAFIFGVLTAQIRWLGVMTEPLSRFFRSIPSVAYVPIMVTLLGITSNMRVTTIAISAFFPILIAVQDGMRSVDATVREVSRAYKIGPVRQIMSVYLPAAGPRIFAGLEVGLATALVVMIASELLGSSDGIGFQTLLAQQTLAFSDMWAGIILLAALGIVTNLIFRVVRWRVLAWQVGATAAARSN